MDIFRMLSRSTKLGQNQISVQPLGTFPSSGENASPQLFGKEEEDAKRIDLGASAVLGKRKRAGGVPHRLSADLDFFGVKSSKEDELGANKTSEDMNVRKKLKGALQDEVVLGTMSQEEKRAMLKAHKIKVTVLEKPITQSTARRKSSEKKDRTIEAAKSNHKEQIYPEPLMSFSRLRSKYGISRRLAENLVAQGYKTPTEVQLAALPLLMGDSSVPSIIREEGSRDGTAHCDLLAVAPTGSGKTLAFLIPVIDAILRDKRPEKDGQTQAVVLAPTRELAYQIVNEGKKLVANTGVKISLMKKGMALADTPHPSQSGQGSVEPAGQEESASEEESIRDEEVYYTFVKSHIVVSTPLSLVHSLKLKDGQAGPLADIRHLVLDEADILLDYLFREQVEAIWNQCTNPLLRTTLWSATMGSSVEELAMKQFKKLQHVGHIPILRLVVGLKDTALPTLTHSMIYTGTEPGKLLALRQLLHPTASETDSAGRKALRPPFLVFTQTIERAKALQAELRYDIPPEAGGSARMAALHSELSETARGKIMTAFRKGEIWVIITTDLLARGVDFRGLNGVVNYDIPTTVAAYIHRVGRTGRAGREGGVAVTFYTKDDIPYVKPIANIIAASEKMRGDGSGKKNLQQWLLDALPAPSKREKKELKKRGVLARRTGAKEARISTKSGYERKMDARKRDMKGGRKEPRLETKAMPRPQGQDDNFAGFSD